MNTFFEKTYGEFVALQWILMAGALTFVVIPFSVPLGVIMGLIAADVLLFILYKDYGKSFEKTFLLFRICMLSYSLTLPNLLFKFAENKLGKEVPLILKVPTYVLFFMVFMALLFMNEKGKKEQLDKIRVRETFLGLVKSPSDDEDYSVVICKNKQTGMDVVLTAKDRYLHLLCDGPTGCGKTSQVLVPMILQDIQKKHGVIVMEPKGDLAEKVYAMGVKYSVKDMLYFNPINPDCPYLNPLDGKEDEVIETMTTVFNMLTPDSKTYFQDMNNNLIRNSLMTLKRIEAAYTNPATGISERPATLIGLSDIVHNPNGVGRALVNELCAIPTLNEAEKKQNEDTRSWFINEYYADRSKVYENTSGIRTQISNLVQNKYLRRVMNPPDGKSQINFDEILAAGKCLAISTAQGALRDLGSYLGYFLIFMFQASVFRRPGTEKTRIPCFFYIDEAQKYLNPGFSDLLTQGRSYRVAVTLATQSREQLAMGSGRDGKSFLEVVSANARNVIAFPGISAADAKYFADAFGETMRVEERHGESKQKFSIAYGMRNMNYPTETVSYTEKMENKYSGSDIVYKPFSEITYRIIRNSSICAAEDGIASWIPDEINNELDEIGQEYSRQQAEKNAMEEKIEHEQRQKMYSEFLHLRETNEYKQRVNEGNETGGTLGDRVTGGLGAASTKKKYEKGMQNQSSDDRMGRQSANSSSIPPLSGKNPQNLDGLYSGFSPDSRPASKEDAGAVEFEPIEDDGQIIDFD